MCVSARPNDFTYARPVKTGNLLFRAMRSGEIDEMASLLAESFADSMLLPSGYLVLLRFLGRLYLLERRSALPHAVTLVGFYEEKGVGDEAEVLAGTGEGGTVEVVFGWKGSNASPSSPVPPRDMPYICNMTVKEELGRLVDTAPFDKYIKAGFRIVETDRILVLLLLQRSKNLMHKELLALESPPESGDLVEDKVAQ